MVSQYQLNLAAELGEWLKRKQWQLVTAESCTGGGIGYAMTAVSGSSDWFSGGYITYSNNLKTQELGVTPFILAKYGAVSAETATAMAQGALRRSGANMAIAVTGIAGPNGGDEHKPVGLVWFGLAWEDHCISWSEVFPGDRHEVRQATIDAALASFKNIT